MRFNPSSLRKLLELASPDDKTNPSEVDPVDLDELLSAEKRRQQGEEDNKPGKNQDDKGPKPFADRSGGAGDTTPPGGGEDATPPSTGTDIGTTDEPEAGTTEVAGSGRGTGGDDWSGLVGMADVPRRGDPEKFDPSVLVPVYDIGAGTVRPRQEVAPSQTDNYGAWVQDVGDEARATHRDYDDVKNDRIRAAIEAQRKAAKEAEMAANTARIEAMNTRYNVLAGRLGMKGAKAGPDIDMGVWGDVYDIEEQLLSRRDASGKLIIPDVDEQGKRLDRDARSRKMLDLDDSDLRHAWAQVKTNRAKELDQEIKQAQSRVKNLQKMFGKGGAGRQGEEGKDSRVIVNGKVIDIDELVNLLNLTTNGVIVDQSNPFKGKQGAPTDEQWKNLGHKERTSNAEAMRSLRIVLSQINQAHYGAMDREKGKGGLRLPSEPSPAAKAAAGKTKSTNEPKPPAAPPEKPSAAATPARAAPGAAPVPTGYARATTRSGGMGGGEPVSMASLPVIPAGGGFTPTSGPVGLSQIGGKPSDTSMKSVLTNTRPQTLAAAKTTEKAGQPTASLADSGATIQPTEMAGTKPQSRRLGAKKATAQGVVQIAETRLRFSTGSLQNLLYETAPSAPRGYGLINTLKNIPYKKLLKTGLKYGANTALDLIGAKFKSINPTDRFPTNVYQMGYSPQKGLRQARYLYQNPQYLLGMLNNPLLGKIVGKIPNNPLISKALNYMGSKAEELGLGDALERVGASKEGLASLIPTILSITDDPRHMTLDPSAISARPPKNVRLVDEEEDSQDDGTSSENETPETGS